MEDLIGVWKGYYTYDKEFYKNLEEQKILFILTIENVKGNSFYGKVEDDMNALGTPGIGKIEGKVKGTKMTFIKRMPILCIFNGTEREIYEDKPHPKIYYSGTLKENNSCSGEWEFKERLIFLNKKILISSQATGKWLMKKISQ